MKKSLLQVFTCMQEFHWWLAIPIWLSLARWGIARCRAYLAMLKATTGVEPEHITGKPNAGMIMHKIEDLGLLPERCAMVGDRLYTDIAMANRAGCVGVLVLSGEATMDDVAKLNEGAEQMPTIIVDSVADLF